jgi:uncharacterized protein (DUF1778 family)
MEQRTKNLNIRLTEGQKQSIDDLAREYGKTTTEFVLLMAEYVRKKRPTFTIEPTERGRSQREYSIN